MAERNYTLKKSLREALFNIMGQGGIFTFADLYESVCSTYPALGIDERKFSTLLYRIRKDNPEIKLDNNLYYLSNVREQQMEDVKYGEETNTITVDAVETDIQQRGNINDIRENMEKWDLMDYIEELKLLIDKAEKFCDQDLTDLTLSSQQVISIRRMLDFTRKLKKLLREEERGLKWNLAEINALTDMTKNSI